MDNAIILNEAAFFAVKCHNGQVRKGGDIPYCVHPLRVGMILSSHGATFSEIMCGLWHDILEDCPWCREDLEDELESYGIGRKEEIITILDSLCKPPSEIGNRDVRNAIFRAKVIAAGDSSIFVKICDRIDNVMDSDGLGDMSELYVVHETGYIIDGFLSLDKNGHRWSDALKTLIKVRKDKMKEHGWKEEACRNPL